MEASFDRVNVRDAEASLLVSVTICLLLRTTTWIVPETLYSLLWKVPLYRFSPTILRTAVCAAVADAVVQTAFTV